MRLKLPISLLSMMMITIGTPAQTRRTIPLSEATDSALRKSQLTLPGSAPFHIKFSVSETTNQKSDRHAQVEEYWISPEKYRRTIQSVGFSQTLIVNRDAILESDTGDYYPYWLYQVVTAVFDPVPFAVQLQQRNRKLRSHRAVPTIAFAATFNFASIGSWFVFREVAGSSPCSQRATTHNTRNTNSSA